MALLFVNDCGKTTTIKKFHGLVTHITWKCSRQDMAGYTNATSQSLALEQHSKARATFNGVSQCADTWNTSAGFWGSYVRKGPNDINCWQREQILKHRPLNRYRLKPNVP
jgi:hypothetical protein